MKPGLGWGFGSIVGILNRGMSPSGNALVFDGGGFKPVAFGGTSIVLFGITGSSGLL